MLQALYRNGVLGTDVDKAVVGANGIGGNGHGLDDNMGVALQNGAVHEGAGVTLVGVAGHIFLIGLGSGTKAPLLAGEEAAAAPSAQAGILDGLDDLLGGHLGEHLAQGGIAVVGDVLVDVFRVDDAAVLERHTHLLLVEVGLVQALDGVLLDGLLIEQSLDHTALEQVLFHDFGHIVNIHPRVESSLGVDDHNGTQGTQAKAAGADHLDLIFQAHALDVVFQRPHDAVTAGGGTAGASAHQYM